jgi:formylglycine-generating enzyme required for sulfatase activity
MVALTWFYWNHALADVDVGSLAGIADHIRIVASEERPASNTSRVFVDLATRPGHTRVWLPAADVIVRVTANYSDHRPRNLAFHMTLLPGLNLPAKMVNLVPPDRLTIQQHPDMAYIPATRWYHGREREPRTNSRPFWIDLRPPTVEQYLPIAQAMNQAGRLQQENSFLLTSQQRKAAVDATGLGQLRDLNKNLGDIFGVIDAANSTQVSAPGDIVVGLVNAPCLTCPAPMTRYEAQEYCAVRHKRLPTDLEWELAVRGVDGRIYPWGNEFDEHRANVPGLPQKGDPPSLKPVDAHLDSPSPYGLIDTVGNAGDWVTNESGSYERVYMGATYQYNPEDATAFRMLPITDSDYLLREITARCVD